MSTVSEDRTTTELAVAAASFVSAFERWARRQVDADGPSHARLRLLYALHCDGPQRMADLAGTLDVTPRSITALVDGLESERLVRRQPHPTDRRATIIELTPDAVTAVERSMEHQLALAEPFAALSIDDRRELLRLLQTVERSMREPD
jgi:DNA-binding MarR family transcriptional regulator